MTMTPQQLQDLPHAGMAERQLRKDGRWEFADMESDGENPINITIRYAHGFSTSDNNDGTFTVKSR